jgi:hypothetical protein
MSLIERWTIWKTALDDDGCHDAYIVGPDAGDWAGDGVEVVPASQLEGAVDLLERAVSLIAQPTIPEHARRRWQAAVDELLGDGTTAGGQCEGERCPKCGKPSASPPAEVYCVECATEGWQEDAIAHLRHQLAGAVAENEKLRLQVAALENDGMELAARLGEAEEQIARLTTAGGQ